jgi:hypothetical protein
MISLEEFEDYSLFTAAGLDFGADLGEVTEQKEILDHAYSFYRDLMGTKGEPRAFLLGPNLWPKSARISGEENSVLERTFTAEELEEILLSMKVDSASGRDGLPVAFYKNF